MAARSTSEARRVRYLLGLSFPAEREQIESEYFEDDAVFQEMLAVEDDLIDAYARGELENEERRRFEKCFASSFRANDRVQFARAFADVAATTQAVETGTWRYIFQASAPLRIAAIAAVIVLVTVPAWFVIDRPSTNEDRKLRAESAKLGKAIQTLQQSSDTKQTCAPKRDIRFSKLRVRPDKQWHREGLTHITQRASHFSPEPFNTVHENVSRSAETVIRGIAKDPQGNVVIGATVTLTDAAKNFTRAQVTNQAGAYVFNAVPPGTYALKVTARGYKTALVSDLVALVNTPTVRDMQLEIGDVSETVKVTSAAEAPINTSDATIGNSFEAQRITELPLNANDVASLLSLQPDVTNPGYVNGKRVDQSNITLDGVDINTFAPGSFNWISFRIVLETPAIHENYRIAIKTADGRPVISADWIEPLTPNQVIIDTPVISTHDLPAGDYVLLLMGKDSDGSFVKVAEYSFKLNK